MIIVGSKLGNFIPSEFDMTAIVANEFIPLIAIDNVVTKEDDLKYYYKPSFQKYLKKPNTLKHIKDSFEMAYTTRKIEINGRNFFIAKGVFFSEAGVPLMVCAMKKEAYLNPSIPWFSDFGNDNFSYNNYVLFYSTSFYTDPGLTPLNRRLQKEILQACYEKGIEVRTISSLEIEKNTFARLFEVKKTKSLTQLEAYMNQVLPNFLHNDGEDTFVEQEFESVVIHREELSVEDEALLFDNDSTPVTEVPWEIPAQTVAEARELAELAAEAAQFDSSLQSSTIEEDEDWENEEQDEDEEEMQRHEEAAHTVSETEISVTTSQTGVELYNELLRIEANSWLSNTPPQTAQSLVDRIRPLQEEYNMQMLRAQQAAESQLETVRWQSLIEVVDDTE